MKLLNLGCGGDRPQQVEWTNLDQLRTFLHPGTPERTNLDREQNYIEWDLLSNKDVLILPGAPYNGIVWQHGPEHFECHDAARIAAQCRASLVPEGMLVMSAPDVRYFMANHDRDTRENAVELFGEPISEPEHTSFRDYALWHREHKQLLCVSGMRAILFRAGFHMDRIYQEPGMDFIIRKTSNQQHVLMKERMQERLTRLKFSTILYAIK